MQKILIWLLLAGSAAAQQPIGEVQGADASVRGAVTVTAAGTTLMSGSQVAAGATPATIKMNRGGELKVCGGGSITITASASGRELLVGLNAGAIETHYRLNSSADTVMTPDFRLLLPGPGHFHFGVRIKGSGDMCVKSLSGNSSALIVHEVFGEGTHQVRPGDGVVFQKGSVLDPTAMVAGEDCGCPSPVSAKPVELGFPEHQSQRAAAAIAAGEPPPQVTPPLAGVSSDKNEVTTKVDAPIVFRGEELAGGGATVGAGNAVVGSASATPSEAILPPSQTEPKIVAQMVPEVVEPPKKVKKKWYQRFGSALAKIFR